MAVNNVYVTPAGLHYTAANASGGNDQQLLNPDPDYVSQLSGVASDPVAARAAMISAKVASGKINRKTTGWLGALVAALLLGSSVANAQSTITRQATTNPDNGIYEVTHGNYDTGALITQTNATAGTSSADQINYNGRGVVCIINVTTLTGTSPTVLMQINFKDQVSGQYVGGINTATLSAPGSQFMQVYPGATASGATPYVLPRDWRVSTVTGGTVTALTDTVGCSVIN